MSDSLSGLVLVLQNKSFPYCNILPKDHDGNCFVSFLTAWAKTLLCFYRFRLPSLLLPLKDNFFRISLWPIYLPLSTIFWAFP